MYEMSSKLQRSQENHHEIRIKMKKNKNNLYLLLIILKYTLSLDKSIYILDPIVWTIGPIQIPFGHAVS